MGWYDGDHMSGWTWLGMSLSGLLVTGLLVLGGLLLVRAARRDDRSVPSTPEQVLADRYARGEIDEEEYRRRLATLTDTGARGR